AHLVVQTGHLHDPVEVEDAPAVEGVAHVQLVAVPDEPSGVGVDGFETGFFGCAGRFDQQDVAVHRCGRIRHVDETHSYPAVVRAGGVVVPGRQQDLFAVIASARRGVGCGRQSLRHPVLDVPVTRLPAEGRHQIVCGGVTVLGG